MLKSVVFLKMLIIASYKKRQSFLLLVCKTTSNNMVICKTCHRKQYKFFLESLETQSELYRLSR